MALMMIFRSNTKMRYRRRSSKIICLKTKFLARMVLRMKNPILLFWINSTILWRITESQRRFKFQNRRKKNLEICQLNQKRKKWDISRNQGRNFTSIFKTRLELAIGTSRGLNAVLKPHRKPGQDRGRPCSHQSLNKRPIFVSFTARRLQLTSQGLFTVPFSLSSKSVGRMGTILSG